uniref:DUF973 family protein n=1 Tax=Thermofilum pendens TaxID=2269 RepID=A0A7C3SKN7_THEPE
MVEQSFHLKGLRLLKSYAELALAAQVLGLVALVLVFPALLGLLAELPRGRPLVSLPSLAGSLALLALAGVLALVGAVLSLVAVYARLIPAGDSLARWRSVLASPAKLMKYGYWAALGLGILALVVVAASIAPLLGELPSLLRGSGTGIREAAALQLVLGLVGALLIFVIAAIAAFVGWVGEVMLLFELSSQTGVQGFRTAAILLILALLTSFISAIPYIALAAAFLPAALQVAALVVIRDSSLKALLPPPPPPGAAP